MTYTESQIEEAARILCENEKLQPTAAHLAYYKSLIRQHLSSEFQSALRQAVERKP